MRDLATQGRCLLETTASFAVAPFALSGAGGGLLSTLMHRIHHHNRHAQADDFCAVFFPDFQPNQGGLRGLGNTLLVAGSAHAVENLLQDRQIVRFYHSLFVPLPQAQDAEVVEAGAAGVVFQRERGADKRSIGKVARELRRNEARLARNLERLSSDTSAVGQERLANAQKAVAARQALLAKAVKVQQQSPQDDKRIEPTHGFSLSQNPGPHLQALWKNPNAPRAQHPGVQFDGFRCDIRQADVTASGAPYLMVNSYGLALAGEHAAIALPKQVSLEPAPRHIWAEC